MQKYTEYKKIGKQMDMEAMRKSLNDFKRFTINLVEGFPDDWKGIADHVAKHVGNIAGNNYIHCFVFNDVSYNCPKLLVVRVPKDDTERPFSHRNYGCIYHTSNEPMNGADKAKSFKLYRPFTDAEKKALWERNRTVVQWDK